MLRQSSDLLNLNLIVCESLGYYRPWLSRSPASCNVIRFVGSNQQIVEPTEGALLFAMGYQRYCPRVKLLSLGPLSLRRFSSRSVMAVIRKTNPN